VVRQKRLGLLDVSLLALLGATDQQHHQAPT
jgi:hypothetical protein